MGEMLGMLKRATTYKAFAQKQHRNRDEREKIDVCCSILCRCCTQPELMGFSLEITQDRISRSYSK